MFHKLSKWLSLFLLTVAITFIVFFIYKALELWFCEHDFIKMIVIVIYGSGLIFALFYVIRKIWQS